MQQHTGILEIRCANHKASTLADIASSGDNKVTIFSTNELAPRIKEELKNNSSNINFFLKNDGESLLSFLRRVEKYCNEHIDLLILNSMRSWQLAFFHPNCKVIGKIYNLNWWLKDSYSISKNLRNLFSLKNYRRQTLVSHAITGSFFRRKLLSNIEALIVEYPPMRRKAQQSLKKDIPTVFFPNTFFQQTNKSNSSEIIKVVVPGMIMKSRKDYNFLLDAFSNIFSKSKNIELTLLGRPVDQYGEEIVRRAKTMASRGNKIQFFTKFIEEHEMEQYLRSADLIIAPIHFEYRSGSVSEKYTYTKGTGSFSDSIRYGTPALVPAEYNIDDETEKLFTKYRNQEDLEKIVLELAENRQKLEELKSNALSAVSNWSLHQLQKKFEDFYKAL